MPNNACRPMIVVLIITITVTSARAQNQSLSDLVRAEGDQYVHLRNSLVERSDILEMEWSRALEMSWEHGLALFVLKERAQERAFESWDKQQPMLLRTGDFYALDNGSSAAATAFLLEKIWKGVPHEDVREKAFKTVAQMHGKELASVGNSDLWIAMWREAIDERLRFVALFFVCSCKDNAVAPLIEEVLEIEHDSSSHSTERCLLGLTQRDTPSTVDIILRSWATLQKKRGWDEKAIGVLSSNSDPRARKFLRKIALDATLSGSLRAEILAGCCTNPQDGDVEMFGEFFAMPGSVQTRTKALAGIQWNCPLALVRPMLLDLMINADPTTGVAAATALQGCYGRDFAFDRSQLERDIATLTRMASREDLSPETQSLIRTSIVPNLQQRGRYVQKQLARE